MDGIVWVFVHGLRLCVCAGVPVQVNVSAPLTVEDVGSNLVQVKVSGTPQSLSAPFFKVE